MRKLYSDIAKTKPINILTNEQAVTVTVQTIKYSLDARENRLITALYGLDGEIRTYAQAADQFGVNTKRIKQLETRTISKLRRMGEQGKILPLFGLFEQDPDDISKLSLSARSYTCLKRAGINTVHDIVKLSTNDWSKIRNFGPK